ncbi:TMAO reductase system periplasmic protein TorT [Vibrio sp. JC009]|uniref:TMAO reductase system periplasmic protein TorT n=1 Tax=Vibrio sp. JC009 TaxID=2912314 RepID=UPI0023B2060B|nr:TMAO reductase system periplasmic protein TorT [Vibrio sp. JC009]WED25010.1 TMAO reductase system periplasmic protein TorT [Vibrio sp. JC009]
MNVKRVINTLSALALAVLSSQAYAYVGPKVCTIYPHLKDSYWLSVNYGMVEEARSHGYKLKVLEAGGYPNLNKQRQQLVDCYHWGADAIILGTVDPTGYVNQINKLIGDTPLFATVNRLSVGIKDRPQFYGEVGVDWYWMGYNAGKYLADKHPAGSGTVKVARLLGPRYTGGTKPATQGFDDAIDGSDVLVVSKFWGDNDKEIQRNLVQKVLEQPDIDYIVGGAVSIEAAISELKGRKVGLISTYLSHGVYRGLLRNKVQFASTDKMVLQGRYSMQQVASYFEDNAYDQKLGPVIEPLTPENVREASIEDSLSPLGYRPIFSVNE